MRCDYRPALLKHRLTLQALERASDGQGGYTESWVDVATVSGGIEPLKGYERMQAMQLRTPVTHRVLVRYRGDLTTAKRLLFGARVFEIKEAINLEEANAWIRLMCVENQPTA